MIDCNFQLNKGGLWVCNVCSFRYKVQSDRPPRHNCTDSPSAKPRKSKTLIIPCINRGTQTGTVNCKTCGGQKKVLIFQCKLFGECSIQRIKENQIEPKPCIICKDREEVAYGQASKAGN